MRGSNVRLVAMVSTPQARYVHPRDVEEILKRDIDRDALRMAARERGAA
jgi:hypothetical protein